MVYDCDRCGMPCHFRTQAAISHSNQFIKMEQNDSIRLSLALSRVLQMAGCFAIKTNCSYSFGIIHKRIFNCILLVAFHVIGSWHGQIERNIVFWRLTMKKKKTFNLNCQAVNCSTSKLIEMAFMHGMKYMKYYQWIVVRAYIVQCSPAICFFFLLSLPFNNRHSFLQF